MKIIKFNARNWRAGMTLPEVMVALGISSLALLVVATLTFFSARSFVAIGNYVDLDNTSRKAVDVMTKEIRQAKALSGYGVGTLTFMMTNRFSIYGIPPAGSSLG